MDLTPVQRSSDGAVVAGVCAGLARRWQVDPIILRIAVVLLSLFAGLGVAVYLGAVLLVPKEGSTDFPIRTLLPFTKDWPAPAIIGAVVGAGVLLVSYFGGSIGIGPAIGLGFLWYFGFYRNRRATNAGGQMPAGNTPTLPAPPAGQPPALPTGSGWQPAPAGNDFQQAAAAWQARVAEHRRQVADADQVPPLQFFGAPTPSVPPANLPVNPAPAPLPVTRPAARRGARWIWPATLCLTGVVLAVLAAVGAPALAFWAAALGCVGIALVVSTWHGRPRGLLPLGIALLLATGIAMAPTEQISKTTVGDQTWTYTTQADLPASRSLDVGSLTVDLRSLTLTSDVDVTFNRQVGETRIILPAGRNVIVDVSLEAGQYTLPNSTDDGLGLSAQYRDITDPAKPTLHIHLTQKLGEVVVER